jgi:Lrp/AsnC family transcriptional regulator, regulator for asnA, asnC and gidA
MSAPVRIDETDKEILYLLIQDARMSLKEIASKCHLSAVSVLNRINHLKKLGVITGVTIFPPIALLGFQIVATIGMETDANIDEILQYLKNYMYLVEVSTSIGAYDLTAVVYAENMAILNERIESIRRRFGVRKVIVNVWSGLPYLNYNNLDLAPLKDE